MTSLPEQPPPNQLEIACGTPFGLAEGVAPLPRVHDGVTIRQALERQILRALQRPPCLVSFSGGRDSSAVLAVAAHVARREGLPLPIPVSLRFPGHPESIETEWQRLVIDAVDLPDWHRPTFGSEMDVIGPIAGPVLRRHGILWPFNSYFHVPIMEAAATGTVLTGVGGDELLGAGEWHRENLVMTRREQFRPLDAARIAIGFGPPWLRGHFLAARTREQLPRTWLSVSGQRALRRSRRQSRAHSSVAFARSLSHGWWRWRSRVLGLQSLAKLGDEHDVRCVSPFAERDVLAAAMWERGRRAFTNRTEAMTLLVGDLVPHQLLARSGKAGFSAAMFTEQSREFAHSAQAAAFDNEYVDIDALLRVWRTTSPPDARAFSALQAAWLQQQS